MCLAVPSRIISKADLTAVIDVYGARKEVSLLLLAEEAKVGDYVLVHAGFAIQRVDEVAAKESLQLLRELAESMEHQEGDS